MTKKITFAQWLEAEFLSWEQMQHRRCTQREFAEFLDIPYPTVSQWMCGRSRPRMDFVFRLARKLGPQVYEVLDAPTPDEWMSLIDGVPDETVEQWIAEIKAKRDKTRRNK